ncbi:PQQ-dependent sugar dehydrogenase [Hylemonella gracilis]|uniref:PQQ-dependent sugar dehydrogenase n=1 Tax=Hylemonella gracilis TaxID=80880 RepID=A0A4P6UKT5_9BURK|nr:PQQ-dependent sugar dehydrogenase [Hylemonella gracilis]QBK05733.1 PQQ-dependent sugar dehydrogenase [Hylemonella gracilis]
MSAFFCALPWPNLASLLTAWGFCLSAPATAQTSATTIAVQEVAAGLAHPWALAFFPEGDTSGARYLVTERGGSLRLIDASGQVRQPVQGLPAVRAVGQGGLLDLMLDSDFVRNRTLYFCYAEPDGRDSALSGTALASARLSVDGTRLSELRVLLRQTPKVNSGNHYGCRITEGRRSGVSPGGTLFVALGERFSYRDLAQTLDNHLGKVLRIGKDGSVPADNPFLNRSGAKPEIWSYGHRNPQGLVMAPDGALWELEHGPMGGDEINLPRPGSNHGWPLVSQGRNYDLSAVGTGRQEHPGTEQPLHFWTPSIAPSGMAFVTSARYGQDWVGNLLVGSLKFGYVARLELEPPSPGRAQGRVVRESRMVEPKAIGQRVRDVRQGPDGFIYVLTDHPQGRLLRLVPAGS